MTTYAYIQRDKKGEQGSVTHPAGVEKIRGRKRILEVLICETLFTNARPLPLCFEQPEYHCTRDRGEKEQIDNSKAWLLTCNYVYKNRSEMLAHE